MTRNILAFKFHVHRPSDEAGFALNLVVTTPIPRLSVAASFPVLVLNTDLFFNITSWPPI